MPRFVDDLIQSLTEAAAMAAGAEIGRVHHPIDPKAVRKHVGLTQEKMAALLGVSVSGYRKWEQGKRAMNGAAVNLLRVLDKNPDAVIQALAA